MKRLIHASMRLFQRRKYFNTILISFLTISVASITLLSFILYINIEKVILENENKANKKVLDQVVFNVNYIDDRMNNIMLPLLFNYEITNVMYGNTVDMEDLYNIFSKDINNIVQTNPFIENIYIYNNKTKLFYSTRGVEVYEDLLKLMRNPSDVSNDEPVLRVDEYGHRQLTYVLYQYKKNEELDGALIIDVNIDWIVKNLKFINRIDKSQIDEIFILDQNGEFINTNDHQAAYLDGLKSAFESHSKPGAQDFFKGNFLNKDYLITYAPITRTGWTMVKVQPYDSVFQNVNSLRTIFMIITSSFLLLIIVFSIILTRRIYRPVGHLVHRAKALTPTEVVEDEITTLDRSFTLTSEEIRRYREERQSGYYNARAFLLRKLVLDSFLITQEELRKARQELDIKIPNNLFIICVFKIDEYKRFQENYTYEKRSLYKFAIGNIFAEFMSGHFDNETVALQDDHLAMIVDIGDKEDYYQSVVEICQSAQQYFRKLYHLSVSITISNAESDIREATRLYEQTMNNSMYRLSFGHMSILTEELLTTNLNNTSSAPSDYSMKRLEEGIKLESPEKAEYALNQIFEEISTLRYDYMILSIANLINTIRQVVEQMNQSRLLPIQANFNTVTGSILNAETLEELRKEIGDLVLTVIQYEQEDKLDAKKKLVFVKMKEWIEEQYADHSLCLQTVSEAVSLSPKHASRMFKLHTGQSVQEYIHHIRLQKSLEYLGDTRISISEIAYKVGIENENYFYTLFKKKFGVTPREYSLSKTIKKD